MLEIHIDRKPVIDIMPRSSQAGLEPKRRIALKAIFLWSPEDSTDKARTRPPKKSIRMSEK